MYDHLDRISEDDDAAIEPVELRVYAKAEITTGDNLEVSIPGFPQLLVLPQDSVTVRLRRALQVFLDGLRNSEAAQFLKHNHTKGQRAMTHEVSVRVPRAIAEAVA